MSLIMFMRIWIIYFSLLQISFVGLKKLFVQKQFGLEKTLGPKKFWSQKIWVGKNFGLKKIGCEKFLVEKVFGSEKMLGLKK